MKDFFISSPGKVKVCSNGSESSLPFFIKLNQYGTTMNQTVIGVTNGRMGNNNFDFSVDMYTIDGSVLSTNLKWLHETIFRDTSSNINITLTKKDIFERFIVLEIADFGSQSMSAFFRNFLPQIFLNGLKIWQKDIAIIKHYSKKIAYILIDRNNTLLKNIFLKTTSDISVVSINPQKLVSRNSIKYILNNEGLLKEVYDDFIGKTISISINGSTFSNQKVTAITKTSSSIVIRTSSRNFEITKSNASNVSISVSGEGSFSVDMNYMVFYKNTGFGISNNDIITINNIDYTYNISTNKLMKNAIKFLIRISSKADINNKYNNFILDLSKGLNNRSFICVTSSIFSHGSFENDKMHSATDDFIFIGIKKNGSRAILYPSFIEKMDIKKRATTYDLALQSPFVDAFKQDYLHVTKDTYMNEGNDYMREGAEVGIELILKESISDLNSIKAIPKSTFMEALYIKENEKNKIVEYFGPDVNNSTVSVFTENGTYKLFDNLSGTTTVEVVPEFSTVRKYLFTANRSATESDFKKEIANNLKFKYLNRKFLNNSFKIGIDTDGKTKEIIESETYKMLMLYDNGEVEEEYINYSTPSVPLNLEIFCSTDNISLNSIFTPENNLTYNIESDFIEFNKCPLSFYIKYKNKNEFIPDFYIILRNFIIPLETVVIDSYTVYYKIPDYFILNDIYNVEYYNNKITNDFLNSIERRVYSKNMQHGRNIEVIYNLDRFNKEISDLNTYQTNLVNSNIVNYVNRNEE